MGQRTRESSHGLPVQAGAPPAGSWVGIVLAVPEPMASQLELWRASFGDPMASLIQPHITLVTTTPADDWEATVNHVRRVAHEQKPFTVTLKGTGSFRPLSPVVFVNVAEGFDACVDLHNRLQRGPLERELAFPYHPHVTVAHDVSEASMDWAEDRLDAFEASFTVRTMGLYAHDFFGVWTLREELRFGKDDSSGEKHPR